MNFKELVMSLAMILFFMIFQKQNFGCPIFLAKLFTSGKRLSRHKENPFTRYTCFYKTHSNLKITDLKMSNGHTFEMIQTMPTKMEVQALSFF